MNISTVLMGPIGPKRKITKDGQPCRKCGTGVVKRTHRKPPAFKAGGYWFAWWMQCPNNKCNAMYMVEEAKQLFGAESDPIIIPAIEGASLPKVYKGKTKAQRKRERKAEKRAAKAARKQREQKLPKERKLTHVPKKSLSRKEMYEFYINSPDWGRFRRSIFAVRGYKCEQCGTLEGQMHVHHLHYRTFTEERPEDVQVLCIPCHEKTHGKKIGRR